MQDSAEKSRSKNGAKQVGYRDPPEATRFKKGWIRLDPRSYGARSPSRFRLHSA